MHRRFVLLLGSVVLLAIAGCASYVERRADAALLEALPKTLGPADRYDVDVSGASTDATRFDRVRVSGYRVARPGSPVIDRFDIDLGDVVIDRAARRVVRIGTASASATVLATDLDAFLQTRQRVVVTGVRLAAPDQVEIGASMTLPAALGNRTIDAGARGRLFASDAQVRFTIDSMQVQRLEAPVTLRSVLEIALNPLVDLSAYAVPAHVDRIDVDARAITIFASGVELRPVTQPAR